MNSLARVVWSIPVPADSAISLFMIAASIFALRLVNLKIRLNMLECRCGILTEGGHFLLYILCGNGRIGGFGFCSPVLFDQSRKKSLRAFGGAQGRFQGVGRIFLSTSGAFGTNTGFPDLLPSVTQKAAGCRQR